jgi:hypothetical protein
LPRAHIILGCWGLSSSDAAVSTIADGTGFDVVTSSSEAVEYIQHRINAPQYEQRKPGPEPEAGPSRLDRSGQPVGAH